MLNIIVRALTLILDRADFCLFKLLGLQYSPQQVQKIFPQPDQQLQWHIMIVIPPKMMALASPQQISCLVMLPTSPLTITLAS